MNKEEFAKQIGLHILNSIQQMQEDKKDFGNEIIIPFKLPQTSDQPEWISSFKIGIPYFIDIYLDKNLNRVHKRVTMAEYYGWKK